MGKTLVIDHPYVNDQLTNLYDETEGFNEKRGGVELMTELQQALKDVIEQAIVDGRYYEPVDAGRIRRVVEKTDRLLELCPTIDDVPAFFPEDSDDLHRYEIWDFSTRVNRYLKELLAHGTVAD